VVDHPYFAVTGADGTFELKNVPPGEYTIEAWQEELGVQEQRVTVAPSGKTEVAFTFKGE
jgi:Polysaccharide lyase family 4, domain II